jgi:hypothetical protein
VNSSEEIWNGPSTVPKSGITTWQFFTVPSKKVWRTSASEAASLKMPAPETLARRTPAPAKSSRQRPADSAWVTSTVCALKASVLLRRPATVANALPSCILRSRSLPFWAGIRVLHFCHSGEA